VPGGVQAKVGHDAYGHGLVGDIGVRWMILEVFSNLYDSMM